MLCYDGGRCLLTQRLVGFAIVWELYRADAVGGSTNPFLPFFLEALDAASTDASEKKYLAQLLATPTSRDVRALYYPTLNSALTCSVAVVY